MNEQQGFEDLSIGLGAISRFWHRGFSAPNTTAMTTAVIQARNTGTALLDQTIRLPLAI